MHDLLISRGFTKGLQRLRLIFSKSHFFTSIYGEMESLLVADEIILAAEHHALQQSGNLRFAYDQEEVVHTTDFFASGKLPHHASSTLATAEREKQTLYQLTRRRDFTADTKLRSRSRSAKDALFNNGGRTAQSEKLANARKHGIIPGVTRPLPESLFVLEASRSLSVKPPVPLFRRHPTPASSHMHRLQTTSSIATTNELML